MKLALFAGLALALAQVSQAASFDCAKASSRSEKQICSDPQLSRLDEDLARSFQAVRGRLSADAQKLLISGQRSWLRFHSSYCFVDGQGKPAERSAAVACQVSLYKSRIAALERAGKPVWGMNAFPYFQGAVRLAPAGSEPQLSYQRREVFLMDGNSATAQALNAILRPLAELEGTDPDDSYQSSVTLAPLGPDLLLIEDGFEGFGGAHPVSGTSRLYFSRPLQRVLTYADVFNSPQWKDLANKLARQHFKKQGRDADDVSSFKVEDRQPFRHPVSASGFSIDGFLSYAERASDGVDLSWKDFVRFLTPLGQQLARASRS
jgi:uncharacterized protein YecT (DUF1311 family)